MQTYIHVRLDPTAIPRELHEDAQLRSKIFCKKVKGKKMEDLRMMAVRRVNRKNPEPPFIPYAIAVDRETAEILAGLPKNGSVSALAQVLLSS